MAITRTSRTTAPSPVASSDFIESAKDFAAASAAGAVIDPIDTDIVIGPVPPGPDFEAVVT